MSEIHQYISAVGSFQGVLLFFLLMVDEKTTAASKVLGLYCLCMGLTFSLPFFTFGKIVRKIGVRKLGSE